MTCHRSIDGVHDRLERNNVDAAHLTSHDRPSSIMRMRDLVHAYNCCQWMIADECRVLRPSYDSVSAGRLSRRPVASSAGVATLSDAPASPAISLTPARRGGKVACNSPALSGVYDPSTPGGWTAYVGLRSGRGPGPPEGPNWGRAAVPRNFGAPALLAPGPLVFDPRPDPENGSKMCHFFTFSGVCGAKPRGSGGAPPTTLILVRNQRTRRSRARRRRSAWSGG